MSIFHRNQIKSGKITTTIAYIPEKQGFVLTFWKIDGTNDMDIDIPLCDLVQAMKKAENTPTG